MVLYQLQRSRLRQPFPMRSASLLRQLRSSTRSKNVNTGPIGCLPVFVINSPPRPGNDDRTGRIKPYNEFSQEFNKQLKDRISQLRTELHGARLTYVDTYSAKYSLISEAQKYGFVGPFINCCGHFGDYHVECGKSAVVN